MKLGQLLVPSNKHDRLAEERTIWNLVYGKFPAAAASAQLIRDPKKRQNLEALIEYNRQSKPQSEE
jgi:hypothetical protein